MKLRDQIEVRPQFLPHQGLAAAVELIDLEELLADRVHFLDPPSRVIQVGQSADAVAATVEQGGVQALFIPAGDAHIIPAEAGQGCPL